MKFKTISVLRRINKKNNRPRVNKQGRVMYHSSGPNTGSNPGGRILKKN